MLSRLLILFSFCVFLLSCNKSSDDPGCTFIAPTVVVPASEIANLQAWVNATRPMAIYNTGGFYYEIITTGTGTVTPAVCSKVTVKYSGRLTSGLKFTSTAEETMPTTFNLGGLIAGWQLGIPLITKGGTINLYLPPSLGYGASATSSIPANSILLFTVELLEVTN